MPDYDCASLLIAWLDCGCDLQLANSRLGALTDYQAMRMDENVRSFEDQIGEDIHGYVAAVGPLCWFPDRHFVGGYGREMSGLGIDAL